MKEIGETFKAKRLEIGVSTDEVESDLKIDSILLENLEDGNDKVFKNVLELKDVIVKYAKYLGLDDEALLNDFNDYLFEKTSKISLKDLKDAYKKSSNIEENKKKKSVKTPYTSKNIKTKNSDNIISAIIIILIVVLVIFIFYMLFSLLIYR